VTHGGVTYQLPVGPQPSLGFKEEEVLQAYTSVATLAYQQNPVVFACIEQRRAIFAQARFQWRQVRGGTPGKLFGTASLGLLEHPWSGASTNDLLSRVMLHADLAGNAFIVRRRNQLRVLRPDWVTIIAASTDEPELGSAAIDAEVMGYLYWPGGKAMTGEPVSLDVDEVAHFAPTPDPMATFRGWSWVNTVAKDIMGDNAATTHKLKFWENGATGSTVVSFDPAVTLDKFNAWVEKLDQEHRGVANAYKTWYLGGGADAKVIGSTLEQADFKVVQGAGETRIASAARVPPAIIGISEGLQGSALNASTYQSARRNFAEGTIWPMWENLAGSLEHIMTVPSGAQLWVDTRHIPFFQEDKKNSAEIQQLDSSAISTLVQAGYSPESVVDAVTAGDLARLEHSGLYSVQLQPAGAQDEPPEEEPPDDAKALIDRASEELIAEGVKPTQAAIAERLYVSDRTIRRWMSA
jgi:phage portal protein BeeE